MNIHEWAEKLNGREAGELSKEEQLNASDDRVCIMHGVEDDFSFNLIFDGVFTLKSSLWEGATINVPSFNLPDTDWEELTRYIDARHPEKCVEWCSRWERTSAGKVKILRNESGCWIIETAIPHSTFEVRQQGEVYCRGIVFHVNDIGATK